jgi:hypothetical protein
MITDWEMIDNRTVADPRAHFAAEPVVSLADAHVLVLGCGSIGGLGAWGLAGAGVGTLTLADRDRLEPANLRRHVCGSEAIGRPKAEAVGGWLRGRFPKLTTVAHDLCFLDQPDELRDLISASEAVLVAVDKEGPKHLIDSMARELRKPVMYVGVYGGGWAGEVILSDAVADTPCYACAARALGRVGIPVFPADLSDDYAMPTASVPESDWPRADLTSLMPIASFAARVVVAKLSAARDSSCMLGDLTANGATAWRLLLRTIPWWGAGWDINPVESARFGVCGACSRLPPSQVSYLEELNLTAR